MWSLLLIMVASPYPIWETLKAESIISSLNDLMVISDVRWILQLHQNGIWCMYVLRQNLSWIMADTSRVHCPSRFKAIQCIMLRPQRFSCLRFWQVFETVDNRFGMMTRSFPGDRTYAPPELLYEYVVNDFVPRRIGTDLYMLGNLAAFLFTGVNVTESIMANIDMQHHWTKWRGTYLEVLPYLQEAFGKVSRTTLVKTREGSYSLYCKFDGSATL